MNKFLCFILSLLILPLFGNAQVMQIFEKNDIVNPADVLIYNEGNSIRNPEILTNATGDSDFFQSLVSANLETFSLELPIEGSVYTLNLFKNNIFSDDFVLKTSDKDVVSNLPQIKTYSGTVEGHNSKLVSITLYIGGIEGLIEIDGNLYTLSKVANTDYHVIYKDNNVTYARQINLENDMVINPNLDDRKLNAERALNGVGCKVLRVYIEVDYTLYTLWGGTNSAVMAKLATVFNASKGCYQNENIDIQLSSSFFWTSNDPYGASEIQTALTNFKTHWNNQGNNFQGDVAHLFTTKYAGGYAAVDVIQTTGNRAFAYGVDGAMLAVGSNFANYARNVIIFTHELGHNIGSRHTQSCTWPVGVNGALGVIDNCVSPESGCAVGPPPVNGGTIMSYCHSIGTSYTTILNNGFGPLPGNLIRSKILSSNTLQTVPPPAPSYSGNTNICAFTKAAITGLGCSNGTYKWYDVASGGTALFTGNTYLTHFLSANKTYYVECVTADCVSQRTQISISVTNLAGPPSSNLTKCGSGSKMIVTSGCSGGTLNWYSTPLGSSPIATGNLFLATGLQVNSSYTYWSRCILNTCSGVFTPHTINVVPSAATPVVAPVTICAGTTAMLTNTGACSGVVEWHNTNVGDPEGPGPPSSANSITILSPTPTPSSIILNTGNTFTTPVLSSNTTYWVRCSNGTCSSSLVPVVVTVTSVLAPIANTPINITAGNSTTLSVTGCIGSTFWYSSTSAVSSIGSGVTFTTPILNAPITYYARCMSNTCQSLPTAFPVGVNGCLPIRILGIIENVSSGVAIHEVSNHIKSTSIITGGTVKYDAANFIELLPGFSTSSSSGGTFKAIIDGCGGF